GAMLLGKIVERVSGEPLDVYLRRHVFAPLGMTSTMFKPPARLLPRIAPTERDPWRGRLVHGQVHDENAYFLGGVSGHAGLFSSGLDLARFARMYLEGGALDGARVVTQAAIDTFTHVQNAALSNRALGWETPNGTNSAGHEMSARAFGHTGFTGTSIWIDPARDLFVILLSNRVDPTRDNPRLGPVRVQLADAVVSVVDARGPNASSTAGATP
ncbi:MAG TPA: serine hydrolase, partial [Gemmatimonadaceae bacterium]|nr:serine hydrolase [Gemmatimonadaceae bacterium]